MRGQDSKNRSSEAFLAISYQRETNRLLAFPAPHHKIAAAEEQGERQREMTATEDPEDRNEADGDSSPAVAAARSGPCVLCLPARNEADEIAGTMLSQLVEMPGCHVEAALVASAAGELIDLVQQRKPRVVCIWLRRWRRLKSRSAC